MKMPIACRRMPYAERPSMPVMRAALALPLGVLMALATTAPVAALEVLPDEKASREACERRFCEIVLDGKDSGPPLACDMTKTWDRVKLKKDGEKNALSWGFGDARCNIALKIPREKIVPALKQDRHTFTFERQTIDCKVEGSDNKLNSLQVDAAPKIKFRNGRAHKVWINVEDVRGESGLKNLVWTATKLADNLGLFHSATVKEINKFIHHTCQRRYGKGAIEAKDKRDGKDKPLRADAR